MEVCTVSAKDWETSKQNNEKKNMLKTPGPFGPTKATRETRQDGRDIIPTDFFNWFKVLFRLYKSMKFFYLRAFFYRFTKSFFPSCRSIL